MFTFLVPSLCSYKYFDFIQSFIILLKYIILITMSSWHHMIIFQEQGMLPAQQGRDVLQVFIMILANFELCAHYQNLTSAVDSTGFKHLDKTISLHDFSLHFVLWKRRVRKPWFYRFYRNEGSILLRDLVLVLHLQFTIYPWVWIGKFDQVAICWE